MRRRELLRRLRRFGCELKRQGKEHELWWNPETGHVEAIPRHTEVPEQLARRICRRLSVTEP